MRESVFVDTVRVPDGRRAVRGERVKALADSIKAVGLINPIQVYWDGDDAVLVAGRHRLEALRSLKIEMTDAEIVEADEIDRELIEIDENLIRSELSDLERAQLTARRVALTAARHKRLGTKTEPNQRGGRPVTSGRGKAVNEIAKSTGRSRVSVHRDLARAEKIVPDVQDKIARLPAANKGVELDAIASLKPAEQAQAVERMEKLGESAREAVSFIRGDDGSEDKHRKALTKLRRAWAEATNEARKQFWNEIAAWSEAA